MLKMAQQVCHRSDPVLLVAETCDTQAHTCNHAHLGPGDAVQRAATQGSKVPHAALRASEHDGASQHLRLLGPACLQDVRPRLLSAALWRLLLSCGRLQLA